MGTGCCPSPSSAASLASRACRPGPDMCVCVLVCVFVCLFFCVSVCVGWCRAEGRLHVGRPGCVWARTHGVEGGGKRVYPCVRCIKLESTSEAICKHKTKHKKSSVCPSRARPGTTGYKILRTKRAQKHIAKYKPYFSSWPGDAPIDKFFLGCAEDVWDRYAI